MSAADVTGSDGGPASAAGTAPAGPATVASRRGAVARALVLGAALGTNFGNAGPVASLIADDLGASLGATGFVTTALLVGHAASQLPAAGPIAHHGPFRVVRVATALVVVGNLACAVAGSLPALLLARLATGLCTGPAFIAALEGFRRQGGALLAGVYGGAVTFGLGLALGVGGLVADAGASWSTVFLVTAGLCALALPAAGPSPAAAAEPAGAPLGRALRAAVRSSALWRLALLHSATFGVSLVVGAWLVPHLERGGISPGAAGLAGLAMLGLAGAVRTGGGVLADAGVGWGRIGVGGALAATAGMALLALPVSAPTVLAAVLVAGVGLALPFAAVFARAATVPGHHPAAAAAFVNLSAAVFGLAATPVAGVLIERGRGALAFALLAAVGLAAAWSNRERPVRRTV